MERNFLVLAAVVFAIALGGFWGLPWLTRTLFGSSRDVSIKVIKAVEDDEVILRDKEIVSRTVVDLELFFPMGGAPNDIADLQVQDERGVLVQVEWPKDADKFERQDFEDEQKTRWTIREAFLPKGFRKGRLRTTIRDLGKLELGAVEREIHRD